MSAIVVMKMVVARFSLLLLPAACFCVYLQCDEVHREHLAEETRPRGLIVFVHAVACAVCVCGCLCVWRWRLSRFCKRCVCFLLVSESWVCRYDRFGVGSIACACATLADVCSCTKHTHAAHTTGATVWCGFSSGGELYHALLYVRVRWAVAVPWAYI